MAMRVLACSLLLSAAAAVPHHAMRLAPNSSVTSVQQVGASALQVRFCTDSADCDRWASARAGAVSVSMPQDCREKPEAGDVQGIAVAFNASSQAARATHAREGDLLLACAETKEGQEEIRQFRASPSLPVLAAEQLASTDCVLLELSGSIERRHAALKRLYSELKMCGFDALSAPAKVAPMRPLGRLGRHESKDEIVAMVSEESYMAELRLLTGDQPLPDGSSIMTRNTQEPGNLQSAAHIARYFETVGLADVSLQEFTCCGGTSTRNVVARQPGVGEGRHEVVVVGAHFDSLPNGNLAPGAVDNGSGTVGVMALAKIFAQFSFNRTIEYVAFGAEEQGLHGSAHYVAMAQARGEEIVAALTMDMIGYSNRFYGVTIEGTSSPPILELMSLAQVNTEQYGPQLTIARSTNSFGSDHVSFQRAGIPAILAIEQDDTNYPFYHRSGDTVDQVTDGQACDIVRGLAGALVDLATGQIPLQRAK